MSTPERGLSTHLQAALNLQFIEMLGTGLFGEILKRPDIQIALATAAKRIAPSVLRVIETMVIEAEAYEKSKSNDAKS